MGGRTQERGEARLAGPVAGVRDVETGKADSCYLRYWAIGAIGYGGVGQSGNTLIWLSWFYCGFLGIALM